MVASDAEERGAWKSLHFTISCRLRWKLLELSANQRWTLSMKWDDESPRWLPSRAHSLFRRNASLIVRCTTWQWCLQRGDLETMVSRLECTRVHFVQVFVLVSRPEKKVLTTTLAVSVAVQRGNAVSVWSWTFDLGLGLGLEEKVLQFFKTFVVIIDGSEQGTPWYFVRDNKSSLPFGSHCLREPSAHRLWKLLSLGSNKPGKQTVHGLKCHLAKCHKDNTLYMRKVESRQQWPRAKKGETRRGIGGAL